MELGKRYKGIPLLALVLLGFVTVFAGAVLVRYWRSSMVSYTYQFTSTGMDAYIIDIPDAGGPIVNYLDFLDNFADPESHVPTILKTAVLEENAFGFPVTNSIAFAYQGGNVGGDLTITIDCNITGVGTEDVTWSVTSRLAGVYWNDFNAVGPCMQDSTQVDYVFTGDTLTIPEAELGRITWVDVPDYIHSEGIPPLYSNFMMLEFSFSGGGGSIGPEDYGLHDADISIAIDCSFDV